MSSRPKSNAFWGQYPNYDVKDGPAVWALIGGGIGKSHGPKGNSCAARISYGLNYGSAPVAENSHASVNLPAHEYMGKKGDGLRYVVSAMGMAAYLKAEWGTADHSVTTAAKLDSVIAGLAEGQCAIFATPSPPGGEGHAGVLRKGYTDPHVRSFLPVDVWVLPS